MSPTHRFRRHAQCWMVLICLLGLAACAPGRRIAKRQPIETAAAIGQPAFEQATARAVRSPWVDGNHVTSLMNGDEFYPAMLKAARSAQKSITFETYAFINGGVTRDFVAVFCDRAKAGVKVHLILDAFGSEHAGDDNLAQLRSAGVQVHFYHDQFFRHPLRYNVRDHRKLMVVDGKIGFTGGCGVANAWTGDTETPDNWRENHYQVTGPVVAQLQRDFNDNWEHTGGETLAGSDYYPQLIKTGNHRAQNFVSGPKDNLYTVPHLYRQVLASAQKSIIIENSYMLPDGAILDAIIDARKRGVHVELIVPGKYIDAWPLRYFSRLQYHRLLKAGVHIYEYQKAMLHCKVMVVDGVFSSVGSANFDCRSLYTNDESNLNVISTSFAREQLRMLEFDKSHSIRVTEAKSLWNPLYFPSRAAAPLVIPQL
ncbi:hypothetical protein JO972_03020 [Verrucomicrobiaceae bacterium 5K15]|uniref:PLD phosphodiesterase domain-containing protein n=1 Tax=Oceaniferula flava TaxID=2800421 RepID=A0AAE2V7J7_9BACT|nr:phospholipase D-like domain-containing protein [Oceaniferula flavus]MBK1853917.1 hypothetical protein [Oceaniferula flavus]MBM1135223.1 hypothetical protein [Oceaniferula flavus]